MNVKIDELITAIFENNSLILSTLSGFRGGIQSVSIRPVKIKNEIVYQLSVKDKTQVHHQNLSEKECKEWLRRHLEDYKQSFFFTHSFDYQVLVGKKGNITILKKKATKQQKELMHNRQKEYIWQEGLPIPFLVHLGVMNEEGKVYGPKKDKFRQINRFLEMVEDVLSPFGASKKISIIDFGCGKAYLTFALYHFLKFTKGFAIHMTGIDLKEEVIQECNSIAQELGYQHDMDFVLKDINQFKTDEPVDMVVSLHACDTATDAALEKAIHWNAKVILSVPCCQHELFSQIKNEEMHPLLKHGILKERFSALVTDAVRVQILEILGYQTQIMEFIDIENTPKNLLIRAVKRSVNPNQKKLKEEFALFKKDLKFVQSLEKRFENELN